MNIDGMHFTVEEWAEYCCKTHTNPYRTGDSHELFDYIKTKQVVTKEECRKFVLDTLLKGEKAAQATSESLLSPRLSSRRGDCRGRVSAQGHIYYMEKLKRPIIMGIREPQSFRLRWRETPLPRKIKNSQRVVIEQVKTKNNTKAYYQNRIKEQNKIIRDQKKEKKALEHAVKILEKSGYKLVKV